jgi:hypothetical protein
MYILGDFFTNSSGHPARNAAGLIDLKPFVDGPAGVGDVL